MNSAKNRILRFILLLAVGLSVLPVRADIYRWKDKDGVMHVEARPPKKGSKRTKVTPAGRYEESRPIARPQSGTVPAPKSSPQVELYTTVWCGFCQKARDYLRQRGVPYTEYDVERDGQAGQRMQMLGARGVPVAVIDGIVIQGFSEGAYDNALTK